MLCPFCREKDTSVIDSRATEDGTAIRRMVQNRIDQLEEILINLDRINGTGSLLRKYLVYGYRPPQIVDVDPDHTLVNIK